MPYNFAADSFPQRNFVADFHQAKCDFFYGNRPFCVFETPYLGLRCNVRWLS